jgi:hypothetical protein
MRQAMVAALGLLTLGGTAHAQSYADDVCHDLRAQRPGLVAPIRVFRPGSKQVAWMCPPVTASGGNLRPVDAEAYVPAEVRSPFQCEGIEPEDGCLVRDGTSIGTHYRR